MCEIPNNVIQIDAFSELFDGFSIGSNDLTQLTLGVDRDSEIVCLRFRRARPWNAGDVQTGGDGRQAERTPYRNLRRSTGKLSGDCAFLTRLGIDSISVNPRVCFAPWLQFSRRNPMRASLGLAYLRDRI